MRLIFIAPSTRHPSGGVSMIYEYASAMANRGHEVHLFHVDFMQANVTSLDDIDWFPFFGDVVHHFAVAEAIIPASFPAADIVFGYRADAPAHVGLPMVLIQGWKMLGEAREHEAFRAPCPKLCVASWLVDIGRDLGVPDQQLVHVPLGLRHEKYRLTRAIADRAPRVSFCYSAHPQKGAALALDVLAKVRQRVGDLDVILFGAMASEHAFPEWVDYRLNPSQEELVDDIYNTSSVFLCTSEVEGFGLTSIEAMACGAALVTTDNGGSHDYAFHDETALVEPTRDADALAEHVVSLLRDDARRVRIATAGREYLEQLNWDRTGELLEGFLERYLADPVVYGYPPELAQQVSGAGK